MKMYNHEFTVKAVKGFTFPLDMLRYDGCFPADEKDARELETTIGYKSPVDFLGMEVRLEKTAEKSWKPTNGRWESFGWKVINHTMTPR